MRSSSSCSRNCFQISSSSSMSKKSEVEGVWDFLENRAGGGF